MAIVTKFYRNHIAEGRGILIFSIVFALCARIIFIISADTTPTTGMGGGYLWSFLSIVSNNLLFSLIGSTIVVAGMAMLVTHINTDFVLIRKRTLLPPAVIIFFFSCHPSFMRFSPAYIGVLFMFFAIAMLFSFYNESEKAGATFKVTFILSLGSLFTPVLLLYIPLIWIALGIMRSFSFKSLFASLLGIFILYFPLFSFYLFTENINGFLNPFVYYGDIIKLESFPFLNFDIYSWIFLFSAVLILSIIIADNFLNRHKDKIKIRACLSLLMFLTVASLLLFIFLNITPEVSLYISIGIGSLLFSHFFALIESKGSMILFYFCVISYFLLCVLSFLSIV